MDAHYLHILNHFIDFAHSSGITIQATTFIFPNRKKFDNHLSKIITNVQMLSFLLYRRNLPN